MTTYASLVKGKDIEYDNSLSILGVIMAAKATQADWEERASRFLKAELKRADVTYEELAKRLEKYGFKGETKASIASKLARGTFAATFLFACLAALELEGVRLEDI